MYVYRHARINKYIYIHIWQQVHNEVEMLSSCRQPTKPKETKVADVQKKNIVPATPSLENNPEVALPLAAATLTALMTQMSASMNGKTCMANKANKSLPVIPIHA